MMRFILFISIVQSILFIGHLFLYRTVVRFFGVTNPTRLFTLRTAFALLSVSLVPTSFLALRYSNFLVRGLYTVAASWLGVVYLFILASILCWAFYGLAKLFHIPLNGKILIEVLMGIAVAASAYGFINSGLVRVTRINLPLPDCPSQWKGKTAVWVSDMHLGPVRNFGFAQDVGSKIESIHPDILFIGGDLYDREAIDLDRVIEPFSRISPHYGTYFVTGNHEEFVDNTPYLEAIRRAGIRVLYNEKVDLNGLQIVGVDYKDSRSEDQFRTILERIDIAPHKPSILLKHTPFNLEVPRDRGISVQLSGHTHHGQVFLFRLITSRVYRGYDYGLKWFGNLLVYTSSGAGTWGPPMRIDTKPEIVVITFR